MNILMIKSSVFTRPRWSGRDDEKEPVWRFGNYMHFTIPWHSLADHAFVGFSLHTRQWPTQVNQDWSITDTIVFNQLLSVALSQNPHAVYFYQLVNFLILPSSYPSPVQVCWNPESVHTIPCSRIPTPDNEVDQPVALNATGFSTQYTFKNIFVTPTRSSPLPVLWWVTSGTWDNMGKMQWRC